MADTKKNQQEYPQHHNHKEGCGFPIARIFVLFGLSCGVVLNAAIPALSTEEVNLFRQLYLHLEAQDITLGDRTLASYDGSLFG